MNEFLVFASDLESGFYVGCLGATYLCMCV